MPNIPFAHMAMVLRTVLAFVAVLGVTTVAGVTIVEFPNDFTRSPLPSVSQSPVVEHGPNLGSTACPTCLFADSNDNLLDYHGRPIDVEKLLDQTPTPTLPLKISFAAPFKSTLKPTPAPPEKSKAVPPPEPTTAAPASPKVFDTTIPPLGNSKVQILTILRARKQQALSIACAIVSSVYFTASVLSVLSPPDFWKSCWTKGKDSGKISCSQTNAPLAMRANCLLEKLSGMIHGTSFDPNTLISEIESTLVNYVKDQEVERAEWQAAEQQRLSNEAAIRNKEILEKQKRKINRIANKSFKSLRKAQREKLIETYERDVLATANVEPSFGPSLRNAETEIRHQLRPFIVTEGVREDLARIFTNILYSFTYAIAVQESLSGERFIRYLSVIDGQNSLIEALRLLHTHREEAYADNESLVRLLCRYDDKGRLQKPDGAENSVPFDKYSPRDDKFIFSPLDGPAALSMKVSVSSAGFQNRPDALLHSDPDWQRFVKSVDRKREEQEVGHAAAPCVPMEDEVKVIHGIKDDNSHDSSQTGEGEYTNGHDGSEKNHHDDEIAAALHRPHDTHSEQSENLGLLKEDEANDENGIKAVAEQDQSGDVQNGESTLDGSRGTEPKLDVNLLKWQIRYLEAGYGTPDDPWAKPYSDATLAVTSENLTGDAAVARQFWEEELAIWRKDRILRFEKEVFERETGVSGNTGSDSGDVGNGASQSQPDPCADVSIQPHQAEHQPKESSKARKRRDERKRAKAKKARETLNLSNEA